MNELFAKRGFVVFVEVVYLFGLFAIAIFYIMVPHSWLHDVLPSSPGSLPAGVPWFGALGAVIISLSGTFDHRADWDPSWNLWHFGRPLIGVSLAIISWLIFQAGILAVGSGPIALPSGAPGGAGQNVAAPTNLLFYLIAFVVGYREEVFRELIKRVADVILTPSGAASAATSAPAITDLNPTKGSTAGGDSVTIAGSGLTGTTSVTFGPNAAPAVHVNSDVQITAVTPPGAPGPVDVTVITNAGRATAGAFTYAP